MPRADLIFEVIAWLRIAAAPTLAGLIAGGIVRFSVAGDAGLALGIIIALIGLVLGIVLATRIWKRHGTEEYLNRLIEPPDKKETEKDEH